MSGIKKLVVILPNSCYLHKNIWGAKTLQVALYPGSLLVKPWEHISCDIYNNYAKLLCTILHDKINALLFRKINWNKTEVYILVINYWYIIYSVLWYSIARNTTIHRTHNLNLLRAGKCTFQHVNWTTGQTVVPQIIHTIV